MNIDKDGRKHGKVSPNMTQHDPQLDQHNNPNNILANGNKHADCITHGKAMTIKMTAGKNTKETVTKTIANTT